MTIKEEFEKFCKVIYNEENIKFILKQPNISEVSYIELNNWKQYQTKPVDDLEKYALTCIYYAKYAKKVDR